MTEIKKYENMTVTVTCAEEVDSELKELMERYKDVKTALTTTKEYYIPRTKAVGEAKLGVILKQLQGLANFAMEAEVLKVNNWIRASYGNDFSGKYETIIVYLGTGGCPCIQWTKDGDTFDSLPLDASVSSGAKNSKTESLLLDKDGWVVKWEEYGIYDKLCKDIVFKMKTKIESMVKEKGRIIDTYNDITAK